MRISTHDFSTQSMWSALAMLHCIAYKLMALYTTLPTNPAWFITATAIQAEMDILLGDLYAYMANQCMQNTWRTRTTRDEIYRVNTHQSVAILVRQQSNGIYGI